MKVLWLAIAALGLTACQGYWEAPIQVREQLDGALERVDLYPGAVGTIQLRFDAPDDLSGPLWMIGSPEILAEDPRLAVIGWAYGPCNAWPQAADAPTYEPADESGDAEQALRLCVAVYLPLTPPASPFYIGAVVDSRLEGRRFTAAAEVVQP
ncbi:MAG: hypothetical protein ACPGU1_22120 [Myxococcota bacterium]